ncbi:MAG: hypothetical protein GY906_18020 [bacterium]|nr:hypothetical protein [bacterium]
MERRRTTSDNETVQRYIALENARKRYESEVHKYMDTCERHERYKRFRAEGATARRKFAEDHEYSPPVPSDSMDEGAWMEGWRGEEVKINNERGRK